MKVFFLTEGGRGLGFGHITRCIAMSDAFREFDITPTLLINGSREIKDILKKRKYRFFNWLKQRNKTFNLLRGADVVIVDSYLAESSFYKRIAKLTPLPVYFDDNKRIVYPPGVVINGAAFPDKMGYPKNKNIKYLLGLSYVPLRREFWNVPRKRISGAVRDVLITFGGEDTKNMTPRILAALTEEYPKLHKKVIVGRGFKNIAEIVRAKDAQTELIFYAQPERIKELMLAADIAISAAGQTLYELVRLGVPTIAVTVAKNQIKHSRFLSRAGCLLSVGGYREKKLVKNIFGYLNSLNYTRRRRISRMAKKMVDGQGARRAVVGIISYARQVR